MRACAGVAAVSVSRGVDGWTRETPTYHWSGSSHETERRKTGPGKGRWVSATRPGLPTGRAAGASPRAPRRRAPPRSAISHGLPVRNAGEPSQRGRRALRAGSDRSAQPAFIVELPNAVGRADKTDLRLARGNSRLESCVLRPSSALVPAVEPDVERSDGASDRLSSSSARWTSTGSCF